MDAILRKPLLIPDPNNYSQELLAEFERRLQIVTLYLSGTSARNLTRMSGLAERSIKTFAKDVLEGKTVDEIIKNQYGNKGKFGLEIAQTELRAFKVRHGRLPRVEDNLWNTIITVIYRGQWIPFGIGTWNDLLMRTFEEVNKENGIYTGEQGLVHVIAKLRAFKKENGRLPKCTDKERNGCPLGKRELFN